GTAVLGAVIAAVAGQPLDVVCRQRIFEPLGMVDSGYAVPDASRERVVPMQTHDGGVFVERPNAPAIQSRGRGDDGLFSTAADYGRFMQLFLNRGRVRGARLVRESTIDAMMTNQLG